MTTKERIVDYVTKCNKKTTYKHSSIDTTILLYDLDYCKKQIYRYLSRYIAVDGEKMGDVIDLLKAIHYCYFIFCIINSSDIQLFKENIRNIKKLDNFINYELKVILSRPEIDDVIQNFNVKNLYFQYDQMFRLLYNMLETHYEMIEKQPLVSRIAEELEEKGEVKVNMFDMLKGETTEEWQST